MALVCVCVCVCVCVFASVAIRGAGGGVGVVLACQITFHIQIQNGTRMRFHNEVGLVPLDRKQMNVRN